MPEYNPKDIETKWQEKWQRDELYKTPDKIEGKENEYVLVEFAYPSGNLHAGHWYAFAVPDIYARYLRMMGKNVLYPMGFDAFGLPAENAAIKHNLNPRDWTFGNILHMRKQLHSMGASFDWSREVITASPGYYKWTQWLFLKFLEKGLAYQKETLVNWCPKDKTVLANEQVSDGKCNRCFSTIEKRSMVQWNMKITDYADRLVEDLETLDWPQSIKDSQMNWIGKSEGAEIEFEVKDSKKKIKVFTTRPDTIFGATYVVLAPEHPLVGELNISNREEVNEYVALSKSKSDIDRSKEKTGIELQNAKAINPATKEEISIWIADYVLLQYGTGAIMAVPAHDERDNEFAKKFDLPIKQVVAPYYEDFTSECKPRVDKNKKIRRAVVALVKHWSEDKYICLQWKKLNWRTLVTGGIEDNESIEEAIRRELLEETGFKNIKSITEYPNRVVSYFFAPHKDLNMMRDGSFVIVELEDDAAAAISEEEENKHEIVWKDKKEILPFLDFRKEEYDSRDVKYFLEQALHNANSIFVDKGVLINSGDFNYTDSDEAKTKIVALVNGEIKTTYKLRDWVVSRQRYWGCPIPIIHCKACGAVPVPEKDLPVVLPDVEDYLPSDDGQSPLSKVEDWVNTKCPKCGGEALRETDTLDTFVDSSWYFLRYTDPLNDNEFASKERLQNWMPVNFYSGGAEHTTMHLLYSRFFHKVLFDLGFVSEDEPYKRRMNRGLILGPDNQKMSKSRGNVIDPDDYVKRLGADTVRMYLAFIGPYNEVGSYPWNPDSIVGVKRFLERVWALGGKLDTGSVDEVIMNRSIKDVGDSIEKIKINTAVPVLMSFVNLAERSGITQTQFETFIKLLAPFAPHISEEVWERLGHKESIHLERWPTYDESKLEGEEVTYGIQINGKVRSTVTLPIHTDEEQIKISVVELPEVQKWLKGAKPKKIIVVKGRVVNIVL